MLLDIESVLQPQRPELVFRQLARQKAALETARLNLDRVKPLVPQNALSKKSLDDAVGVYESYAAAVEQAKAILFEV